ncbi:MAG: response regulator, partial [Proteobacteria bacterium]|nr:response regulator [Pseudomonadota bacterium]
MRILVIEDGFEYTETLEQFLSRGFSWERAGSGPEGVELLKSENFEGVFLDMRFDRVPVDLLFGDLEATADRFNGDPVQARCFLEDHQGNYILAAIRQAGIQLPVLMSYDFDGEPRRWKRISKRFAPVDYLPDNGGP